MTCDYSKIYRVDVLPALADQELNAWYLVSNLPGLMTLYVKGNDPLTAPRTIASVPIAAGSNTQVLYNNNGVAAGSSNLTWDNTAKRLTVNGRLTLPFTSATSDGIVEIGGVRQLSAYGSQNVFLGPSGNLSLTGQRNVGAGHLVLSNVTSGSFNVGVGYECLRNLTAGNFNLVFGYQAGLFLTTGNNNVLFGPGAGAGITTGSDNYCFGFGAGQGINTGSYNVILGKISGLPSALSNTIILSDGQGNERLRMDANRADFKTPPRLPNYTVLTTPSASSAGAGAMIYVTNESGGAVPAFSDGTNWRRVTDRAIIS